MTANIAPHVAGLLVPQNPIPLSSRFHLTKGLLLSPTSRPKNNPSLHAIHQPLLLPARGHFGRKTTVHEQRIPKLCNQRIHPRGPASCSHACISNKKQRLRLAYSDYLPPRQIFHWSRAGWACTACRINEAYPTPFGGR